MAWLFICSVADNVFEIAVFEVDATEMETAVRHLRYNKEKYKKHGQLSGFPLSKYIHKSLEFTR